jgi:hypothetical protein
MMQKDATEAQGLELLLRNSNLIIVWNNLLVGVKALEAGVQVVRIYQTSVKAARFIKVMKSFCDKAMVESSQGWSFAAGWAFRELVRLKMSPDHEIIQAAGDASVIYRNVAGLWGDWLVHAPGALNQWLHSQVFTVTKSSYQGFKRKVSFAQTPTPGWGDSWRCDAL